MLRECPWLPLIGNHESTSGSSGLDKEDASTQERYLNQTWGVVSNSTATSALGHLLTKGTFYASGVHGGAPGALLSDRSTRSASRTSQWTSVDIGLVHVVALDLDPSPAVFVGEQVEWLKADLAAADANRESVPWIVVTSHFPLYSAKLDDPTSAQASL